MQERWPNAKAYDYLQGCVGFYFLILFVLFIIISIFYPDTAEECGTLSPVRGFYHGRDSHVEEQEHSLLFSLRGVLESGSWWAYVVYKSPPCMCDMPPILRLNSLV